MSTAIYLAMEHAALASWPARETQDHGGWLLRASDGVTKRANSATVLGGVDNDPGARIAHCEAFYRERGLPCIIRLPGFVEPGELDARLADRGYRFLDLSLVLYRRIAHQGGSTGDVRQLTQDSWLSHFSALAGLDDASRQGQAGILARIADPVLYGVLEDHGEILSAGLGVVHGPWFGIFDVVTRSDRRGQGLGSRLITGMLQKALAMGARESYLQVVAGNTAAISVYERLGYRRVYDYWYRTKPSN